MRLNDYIQLAQVMGHGPATLKVWQIPSDNGGATWRAEMTCGSRDWLATGVTPNDAAQNLAREMVAAAEDVADPDVVVSLARLYT